MGVPVPRDSGDSEASESPGEIDETLSELLSERLSEFLARETFGRSPSNGSSGNNSAGSSTNWSTSSSQQPVTEHETVNESTATDGAGFGEPRPKLARSESGPVASSTKLGKSPQGSHVQRPKSSSSPLPPGNIGASAGPATSPAPAQSRTAATTGQGGSQTRPPISNLEPGQQVSQPPRGAHKTRPFHQLIHCGRKKHWKAPVPTDPLGPEDLDVPYQHKFLIDANVLLPSVREIFVDKPEEKKPPPGKYSVAPDGPSAGFGPDDTSSDGGIKSSAKGKGKGKELARSPVGYGSPKSGPANLAAPVSTRAEKGIPRSLKRKAKRKRKPAPVMDLPPAITVPPPGDDSHKVKKTKMKLAHFEDKQEDNDYRPRGAMLGLEPIVENKPLRFPRKVPRADIEPKDEEKFDPDDPLFTWYFPRKSPDYWEMLDDVAKMFEDLQIQDMTLKHFQRPIDYVTVLLCLSNVVFAEMFETLQERVTDGQYRIEFVMNGRTGVNLYLSAYSREHTYIAKSWMHKINMQVDIAKKDSPRSILQYVRLIECVERGLVHDRFKSWGRIPDGQYNTWTDIDSPTVIHEVGIAESRAELYRRCRRYMHDIPSVNLVVAIKVDSSECDWAEMLLLARDPGDDEICMLHNWVRFWGHGAVNTGELLYYPSDFLEIEDRWKIPVIHMRPLRILDGPRTPIVKISFGELGRMVSLAKWENQALMGYVTKPLPWPAGYGGLKHIERLSVVGEDRKPPPDFARTLAVAAAVADHHWVKPFVSDEWRDEAKRELDEWTEHPEIVAGADDWSPEESSEPEESESEEDETDSSDEEEEEGPPIWPKGVTGLI